MQGQVFKLHAQRESSPPFPTAIYLHSQMSHGQSITGSRLAPPCLDRAAQNGDSPSPVSLERLKKAALILLKSMAFLL